MKATLKTMLIAGMFLCIVSVFLSCSNAVLSDEDIVSVDSARSGLVSTTADEHNEYLKVNSSRFFLNNMWGVYMNNSPAVAGSWQTCKKTSTGWRADYELWNKYKKNDTVLGYPSMLNGWHYGEVNPAKNKGGFPVRIYDNKDINVSWKVVHGNKGDWECYNTAYDIWVGGIDQKDPSHPDTEIMIWLNRKNQQPIGSYVTTISKWGAKWDFYSGTMSSGSNTWQVYSFVRTTNTWKISNVNIRDFINYLWKDKQWLDGRKYIVGIEAGNEIIQGKGYSETQTFSMTIK